MARKVYLSGRITGQENYKAVFRWAAADLTRQGYVVLNPAILPQGLDEPDYMRIALAMLDSADAVALLPDWNWSKGARIEADYCERIGKRCETISSFVNSPEWAFPVRGSERPWNFVPWAAVERHRRQVIRNHGKPPEQLAEGGHGGLMWKELYYVLNDRDYQAEESIDFQSLVLDILADEYSDF